MCIKPTKLYTLAMNLWSSPAPCSSDNGDIAHSDISYFPRCSREEQVVSPRKKQMEMAIAQIGWQASPSTSTSTSSLRKPPCHSGIMHGIKPYTSGERRVPVPHHLLEAAFVPFVPW